MTQPTDGLSMDDLKEIERGLRILADGLQARANCTNTVGDYHMFRLQQLLFEDSRAFGRVHKKVLDVMAGRTQQASAQQMVEALNIQSSQDGEVRATALIRQMTEAFQLLDLLFAASENVKGSVASYRPHPDMNELRSSIIGMKVFFSHLASLHKNSATR